MQFYLQDRPNTLRHTHSDTHTHTHTQMKRKPKVLYSTLQPMSETSWGSEFGLYLVVGGKGVLGNAAPVTGRWPGPSRMCGTRGLWPAAA